MYAVIPVFLWLDKGGDRRFSRSLVASQPCIPTMNYRVTLISNKVEGKNDNLRLSYDLSTHIPTGMGTQIYSLVYTHCYSNTMLD